MKILSIFKKTSVKLIVASAIIVLTYFTFHYSLDNGGYLAGTITAEVIIYSLLLMLLAIPFIKWKKISASKIASPLFILMLIFVELNHLIPSITKKREAKEVTTSLIDSFTQNNINYQNDNATYTTSEAQDIEKFRQLILEIRGKYANDMLIHSDKENELVTEIAKSLSPAQLINEPGRIHAKRIIEEYEIQTTMVNNLINLYLNDLEKYLDDVDVSNSDFQRGLHDSYKSSFAKARALYIELNAVKLEMIQTLLKIIELIDQNSKFVEISNSKFLFENQATLDAYNALEQELVVLSARETQIMKEVNNRFESGINEMQNFF